MQPLPFLNIEHTRPFLLAAVTAAIASTALRLAVYGIPQELAHRASTGNLGVLMLFAPLCALLFAMLFEAGRLVYRGALPAERPPARRFDHWGVDTEGTDRAS